MKTRQEYVLKMTPAEYEWLRADMRNSLERDHDCSSKENDTMRYRFMAALNQPKQEAQ
jgi:hypothetical protein